LPDDLQGLPSFIYAASTQQAAPQRSRRQAGGAHLNKPLLAAPGRRPLLPHLRRPLLDLLNRHLLLKQCEERGHRQHNSSSSQQ
jgi:hypothetical protein